MLEKSRKEYVEKIKVKDEELKQKIVSFKYIYVYRNFYIYIFPKKKKKIIVNKKYLYKLYF